MKMKYFYKTALALTLTLALLIGCTPGSGGELSSAVTVTVSSFPTEDTPDPNRFFYREDAVPVKFTYDMEDPALQKLDETYQISEIAGEGDTLERSIRILKWISKNINHNGMVGNYTSNTTLDLMEYAYGKGEDFGINCRCLSMILSAACMSQGIQARPLWLMPYNPNDPDCHVIAMVYLPEYSKWVFLDPTYSAYFTDLSGNPLSPIEIRDAIYSDTDIHLNEDAHYNEQILTGDMITSYLQYLHKDMYFFYSLQNTTSNPQEKGNSYYLCPTDFDAVEWKIKNQLFFFRSIDDNTMSQEERREYLEKQFEKTEFIYATSESFWAE